MTTMEKALTRSLPNAVLGSRLFNDDFFSPSLLRTFFPESAQPQGWVPPVDIRETTEAYEVSIELPGMKKEDVKVTMEDNVLSISGERQFESTEAKGTVHRTERAYGSFSRAFTLPTRSDVQKVKATFKDGLLTLTVPKAEEARARQIEIS